MRLLSVAVVTASILLATPAFAQGTYCDGFRDGWRAAFVNRGLSVNSAPTCTSSGPNTYDRGYEAGLAAALAQIAGWK